MRPQTKIIAGALAKAPPVLRPLTDLDGPLSHLLAERSAAELALERAKLNVEWFAAAVVFIIEEAAGRPVDPKKVPVQVLDWVVKIRSRAGERFGGSVSRSVEPSSSSDEELATCEVCGVIVNPGGTRCMAHTERHVRTSASARVQRAD